LVEKQLREEEKQERAEERKKRKERKRKRRFEREFFFSGFTFLLFCEGEKENSLHLLLLPSFQSKSPRKSHPQDARPL
jgi:hypothetical protein